MSVRPAEQGELSTKQRLCLFHGSDVKAESALAMNSSEITYQVLLQHRIKARNIAVAGIGPSRLLSMGVENASQMRALGFDALYLADPRFASEANFSFGSHAVKEAYLQSASDAVAISGTDAMDVLGVSTDDLMSACAGAPIEAQAVLQQLPLGTSLQGVSAVTVLDTGLRKAALVELGYSLTSIVKQTNANAAELAKLGYSM